eukprot:4981337-Amphidinium_carterae.1
MAFTWPDFAEAIGSPVEAASSAKRRAVDTKDPMVRQLAAQTAKAFLGAEARSRRTESALSHVVLLPKTHP